MNKTCFVKTSSWGKITCFQIGFVKIATIWEKMRERLREKMTHPIYFLPMKCLFSRILSKYKHRYNRSWSYSVNCNLGPPIVATSESHFVVSLIFDVLSVKVDPLQTPSDQFWWCYSLNHNKLSPLNFLRYKIVSHLTLYHCYLETFGTGISNCCDKQNAFENNYPWWSRI